LNNRLRFAISFALAAVSFADASSAQTLRRGSEIDAPIRRVIVGPEGLNDSGVIALPDGQAPDQPSGPAFGPTDADISLGGDFLIGGSDLPTPTVDPIAMAPSPLPPALSTYLVDDSQPIDYAFPLQVAGTYTGTWGESSHPLSMADGPLRVGKLGLTLTNRAINGRRMFFASVEGVECDGKRLVREYHGTYVYDPSLGEVALTFFDVRGRVSGEAKLAVAAFSRPTILRTSFEVCGRHADATLTQRL